MKRIIVMIISTFLVINFTSLYSQESQNLSIKWMTLDEVQKEMKKKPKKIFIDVYTDWCHWCKVMDKNTFSHSEIIKYITTNYYCVKFNAETKEEIIFNNKKYVNVNPAAYRSAHQFAYFLTKGRLSYPTIVILGENMEVIQSIAGYQNPQQMETILNYFATDAYKTKDWETFKASFVGKIKE